LLCWVLQLMRKSWNLLVKQLTKIGIPPTISWLMSEALQRIAPRPIPGKTYMLLWS
jgi:hypothetical protein